MAYQPGDRVRTTVDTPSNLRGDPGSPAGSIGTVTHAYPGGAVGVLLDNDPWQMAAHYNPDQIRPA